MVTPDRAVRSVDATVGSKGSLEFAAAAGFRPRMVRWSMAQLRPWLTSAAACVVVAVLLMWLMGAFGHRVAPGEPTAPRRVAKDTPLHTVALQRVPATESAVGTIRAVRETAVASRILGRIATLAIERAGQAVHRGDVLVALEAADLQAAADQARAALTAARTRADKARIDRDRTQELVQKGVAAPDRLETDAAALRAAEAQVEQAVQALAGAETALTFATVTAPIDGIVVDKKVNVGDVVQPGQLLCTLYDPARLQLVAVVREELAGVLAVGQEVDVSLDALGKQCRGTIAEIVPDAQALSRSFEVKVVGPCQPGIVTGMFGRLHVPLGEREIVAVPAAAVAAVGQLDFVYAVDGSGAQQRRYVRTGRRRDGAIEILAGLTVGERIVADARDR